MVPRRLWLRNFLSYGDEGCPLDLSQVHVAALIGPNGAGKSSLIDAITWALFGRARSRSHEELVRKGATEMEVVLEFLVDGHPYRIHRTYSRRTNTHRVDLQQFDPVTNKWKSLSFGGVRETDSAIQRLLRMDYTTFISTVCQLQGQSGEFMALRPSDRRDRLADILGLSDYERWEERAKEKARELAGKIRQAQQEIAFIEKELNERPHLQQKLDELNRRIQETDDAYQDAQEEWRRWQEEQERLRALQERRHALQEALHDLQRQRRQAAERLNAYRKDRDELQGLLDQKVAILEDLAKYRAVQEEENKLAERQRQWEELQRRKMDLERRIAEERAELKRQEGALIDKRQQLEEKVSEKNKVIGELDRWDKALKQLDEWQRRAEVARQKREEKVATLAALRSQQDILQRQREEVAEKLRLLLEHKGEPKCPLCEGLLTPEDFLRLRQRLEQEKVTLEEQARDAQAQSQHLQAEIDQLDDFLRKAEKELQKRPFIERCRGQLQQTLSTIQQAEQELARWQTAWDAFQQKRAQTEQRWQKEKEALNAEEATIGYDAQRHDQLRQWLRQNERILQRVQQLQDAERRLPQIENNIAQEQRHLAAIEERIAEKKKEAEQLDIQLKRQDEVQQQLQALRQRLADLEGLLRNLNEQKGQVEGQLKALRQREETLARLRQQIQDDLEAKQDYELLAEAFGRAGVPKEILKVAVQWLQDEAHALLMRLSKGQLALRFELTQPTQSGTEKETLNIIVSDPWGDRPYESYSGGEKFRIDFALRIALARLLARRSGAALRTLIIDEGFSSQDKEGLEAMVDAIQAVAKDFDRVLVVTHLDELRDQFPTLIEVVKDSKGSRCRLIERNETASFTAPALDDTTP